MSRSTWVTESIRGVDTNARRRSLPEAQGGCAQAALRLVTELCDALERHNICYCHWKSNQALDRSASGENDLDLLIARNDAGRFTRVLHELGFKEAVEPARKMLPGVRHYFGVDGESSRLVHVHAHYQLVIGDDATKNYRLPIEEPYLNSSARESMFRVPAAEFEFVVFVVRLMLKHGTWDAVLRFRGRLSEREGQELAYLSNRVDEARMYATLSDHLPFIKSDLFRRCVRSLESGCSPAVRVRAGRELSRSLEACARRSRGVDAFLKLWRRGTARILRLVFRRRFKNRLAAGGAIVAVVGGDGAGKSTAVDDLHTWLSSHFLVRKVHLGKPRRSWSSLVVKGLMWMGRSLGVVPKRTQSFPNVRDEMGAVGVYVPLIWHTLTARDRYRGYVRARRVASRGGIVICDRYPLRLVTFMDGPRANDLLGPGQVARLAGMLARLESGYYDRILEPDVLVVLTVDPEIAVHRRIDEDPVTVRRRSTEILGVDWEETSACVVDAGDPLPEVVSTVRSLVWSRL